MMALRPCPTTAGRSLRAPFSPFMPASPRSGIFRHSRAFSNTQPTKNGDHSLLKLRIPSGSWDSHMHVMHPRYPIVAKAAYRPTSHTIEDALAFESSQKIDNLVLVQPSIYGFDNSCLLDALRCVGPSRGRGVVVVDSANTEPVTLRDWDKLGVRGVRINFRSSGRVPTHDELERILSEQAQLVRSLGWMIQIHTHMSTIPLLEKIVPQLGVKVCIDHFGGPDLPRVKWEQGEVFDPYSLPGFSSLIELLRAGKTYVKVSAPYRLSRDKDFRDLGIMTREFLRQAPNRVLYATDWPHTRYSGISIESFTQQCIRICGSQAMVDRIFRLNTEELMDSGLDS